MIECVNKKVMKEEKWQKGKSIRKNLKIQQYKWL
jgi:hypothetical protein